MGQLVNGSLLETPTTLLAAIILNGIRRKAAASNLDITQTGFTVSAIDFFQELGAVDLFRAEGKPHSGDVQRHVFDSCMLARIYCDPHPTIQPPAIHMLRLEPAEHVHQDAYTQVITARQRLQRIYDDPQLPLTPILAPELEWPTHGYPFLQPDDQPADKTEADPKILYRHVPFEQLTDEEWKAVQTARASPVSLGYAAKIESGPADRGDAGAADRGVNYLWANVSPYSGPEADALRRRASASQGVGYRSKPAHHEFAARSEGRDYGEPENVLVVGLGPSKQSLFELQTQHQPPTFDIDSVWGINAGVNWLNGRVSFDMLWCMDFIDGEREAHPDYVQALRNWALDNGRAVMTSRRGSESEDLFQEYPLAKVVEHITGISNCVPYFRNSLPYVIAYALYKGVRKLHLWGVDYSHPSSGAVYEPDRANCEYWVGFARAAGMEVYLPTTSTLLRSNEAFGLYGYPPGKDRQPRYDMAEREVVFPQDADA